MEATEQGKTDEDKKKGLERKFVDNITIEKLGRALPPRNGIRASEMKEDPRGNRFPKYRGYVLAIAGANYTVIACGVGQGEGQALPPRDVTYRLNDKNILASHGFHNDVLNFNKDLRNKIDECEATLKKQMSTLGTAGIVKALLYNRRCYTYFKCNILAGVDQHDGGCLYVFDQLGGFKREAFGAGGSSSLNMHRLLARKVNLKNQRSIHVSQDENEAADLVTSVFSEAEEQRIFRGHAVVIYTITKTGTMEQFRRVKD
ncbi:proteasome subunit beta type-1-like isoform X2 [Haliotis cracherodii]|uniref:proteasome subunit beta type-1-like isoform X2 n=1 Tax=Haliotis cracherodii TaxID=6455 RepID=UPI0039ECBE3B